MAKRITDGAPFQPHCQQMSLKGSSMRPSTLGITSSAVSGTKQQQFSPSEMLESWNMVSKAWWVSAKEGRSGGFHFQPAKTESRVSLSAWNRETIFSSIQGDKVVRLWPSVKQALESFTDTGSWHQSVTPLYPHKQTYLKNQFYKPIEEPILKIPDLCQFYRFFRSPYPPFWIFWAKDNSIFVTLVAWTEHIYPSHR